MFDSWTDGLAYEVIGTPLWAYLALLATFVGTYTAYRILMRLLASRWLLALSQNQPELYESIIGLVRNPLRLLQLTIAVAIGIHYFALPEAVHSLGSRLLLRSPARALHLPYTNAVVRMSPGPGSGQGRVW